MVTVISGIFVSTDKVVDEEGSPRSLKGRRGARTNDGIVFWEL